MFRAWMGITGSKNGGNFFSDHDNPELGRFEKDALNCNFVSILIILRSEITEGLVWDEPGGGTRAREWVTLLYRK